MEDRVEQVLNVDQQLDVVELEEKEVMVHLEDVEGKFSK